MGIITILPEELNIDQVVNIYIFKKNIDLKYGINFLFIPLFDYDGYKIYGILYQRDIVKKKFYKIDNYVKSYVNKEKCTDPSLF